MAALAVCAELAAVNVSVAVCAMRADLLEDQVRMALRAFHFLMHSPQGIPSLIMIEFRIRTGRFPACVGVAVLAGNRDWAVRIRDFGPRAAQRWT